VNFTREPIIETIITPKEGFRLVIRNSNGNSQEEYSVNSVEVVSFGKSFFFRSLEKPKAFLLPVSDYEVLESREIRTVLKKPQIDKPIKIAGGKASGKSREKEVSSEKESRGALPEEPQKRERDKTSHRPRFAKKEDLSSSKEGPAPKEQGVPPIRRTLLPPPTSLISEQISRYKDYLMVEGAALPEELEGGNKIEELPKKPSEDLSFFSEEGVSPKEPSLFEEKSQEEGKVDDSEEEKAPSSIESDD